MSALQGTVVYDTVDKGEGQDKRILSEDGYRGEEYEKETGIVYTYGYFINSVRMRGQGSEGRRTGASKGTGYRGEDRAGRILFR